MIRTRSGSGSEPAFNLIGQKCDGSPQKRLRGKPAQATPTIGEPDSCTRPTTGAGVSLIYSLICTLTRAIKGKPRGKQVCNSSEISTHAGQLMPLVRCGKSNQRLDQCDFVTHQGQAPRQSPSSQVVISLKLIAGSNVPKFAKLANGAKLLGLGYRLCPLARHQGI